MSSSRSNTLYYLALLIVSFLSLASALTIPSNNQLDISIAERDVSGSPGMSIDNSRHLMARASPTLCGNLTVYLQETINGVKQNTAVIIPTSCYCVTGGSLTSESDSRLRGYLATTSTYINQTAFSQYLNTNGFTRAQGVTNIVNAITAGENGKTTTCTYPPNAIPVCGDGCPYNCASGYKVCGSTCIASGSTCTSGRTARKREAKTKVCAAGFAACATGLKSLGGSAQGWECVNVATDIESCGGCQQPMPGGKTGQDCTAISGADEVACISGSCHILRCSRGYRLESETCVPIDADTPPSTTSKFWTEQLKATPNSNDIVVDRRASRRRIRIKAGDVRRKSNRAS